MKLSIRQEAMMQQFKRHHDYIPIGLTELVDPDFIRLVELKLVTYYMGMGASLNAHPTGEGYAYLGIERKTI